MKTSCTATHPKRDVHWRRRHWNPQRGQNIKCNKFTVSILIPLLLPLLSMRMLMIRALLSI